MKVGQRNIAIFSNEGRSFQILKFPQLFRFKLARQAFSLNFSKQKEIQIKLKFVSLWIQCEFISQQCLRHSVGSDVRCQKLTF